MEKTINTVTKYALLNGCLLSIFLFFLLNYVFVILLYYADASKKVFISDVTWSGVYLAYFPGFLEKDTPRYLL